MMQCNYVEFDSSLLFWEQMRRRRRCRFGTESNRIDRIKHHVFAFESIDDLEGGNKAL